MHNFTETQKIDILVQGSIIGVQKIIADNNIPRQTFYSWRRKYEIQYKEKLKQRNTITLSQIYDEIGLLKIRLQDLEELCSTFNTTEK